MQDGNKALEENRVMYPDKKHVSWLEARLTSRDCKNQIKSLHQKIGPNPILRNATITDKFDQNANDVTIDEDEAEGKEMQPLTTNTCKYVVSFSNLMSLQAIKRRAYLQKVSVNEFILGCISKATCIYSDG